MSVSRETQGAVLPWHPVQRSVSRETELCVNSPRSAVSRETDADPNANSARESLFHVKHRCEPIVADIASCALGFG
jgi:hypothetical protein